MLDANMELDRLRRSLEHKKLSREVIEEVISLAKGEISEAMSRILQDGLQEAIEAGEAVHSDAFIAELTAINVGNHFEIGTDSGKTDFTEPPWPMLPSLLKNAKTASDGSQYKVIPISQKDASKPSGPSKTTVDAMRALNQSMISSAKGKQARKHGERSGTQSILEDSAHLAGYYGALKPNKPMRREKKPSTGAVEFRVASSKHNPMTQWVHPGNKADMSEPLRKINADVQNKLAVAITEIVSKYEEMY